MSAKDRYLRDLLEHLGELPLPVVQPPTVRPAAPGWDSRDEVPYPRGLEYDRTKEERP